MIRIHFALHLESPYLMSHCHPGLTQKKACHVMNEYILSQQPQRVPKQRFKATLKPIKDVYYFITATL